MRRGAYAHDPISRIKSAKQIYTRINRAKIIVWSLVYRCWMQAHLQAPQPLHECEHFQSHPTPTAPDYDDFEWYQKWRIVQTAVSNLHYLFRTAIVIFSLLLGCQFVWYFLFLSVSIISISTNTQEWISMYFSRYSEMAYTWIQDVCFFFNFIGLRERCVYYLHTGKTCDIFLTFSR